MNIRHLLIPLSLIIPSISLADIHFNNDTIEFYAPDLAWRLKLPAADWKLAQEKRRPDGGGYYYHLTSSSVSLNFSVFLDKTDSCNSPDSCRDRFWANPGPAYSSAMDVEKFSVNDFSTIRFYIDQPMGHPVLQSNISAHGYRDGFWIDIHISEISTGKADYTAINKVISQVTIE